MSRTLAIAGLAVALAGCATLRGPVCAPGDDALRTAQLYLGATGGKPAPSDADLKRFVAEEITPRFSGGVTVMDGGGQWKGANQQWVRDASKVVMIVLPPGPLAPLRVRAVIRAYAQRFGQPPMGVFVRQGCATRQVP